jgi:hypothetical protein
MERIPPMIQRATTLSIFAAFLLLPRLSFAEDQKAIRFFGGNGTPVLSPGPYDPAIPPPEKFLGHPIGDQPVRHARVLEYLEALDAATDRVRVVDMGSTYEGRRLVYVLISDESNMARLKEINDTLDRLADPRTTEKKDAQGLIDRTPAVAWMAYSIHGDEISGVDASIAVAYNVAAGMDTASVSLRRNLVTIIDPAENPDGRERYLAQMESFAAAVPHADGQSLQKGGFWPWGRGNHYLFDMNRDWFTQELPESRARIAAIVDWHPQLVVDAHEMGQWDTYLFSPPRHPFNLQLTDRNREWWEIFARDQARTFDERGWAYYTRDWNEEWYPGYGSSWPLFTGAVGILYEQAGVSGSRVSRHDGTVLTYAEAVQHHYVSSMANLNTASRNRRQLLGDYYEHRANAVETFGGGKPRAFLVTPDSNGTRFDHLAATLIRQGIEVAVAEKPFSQSARDYYSPAASSRRFPEGTMIIRTDQPQGYLAQTILGFDPHVSDSFLVEERRELLKNRSSRLYEITSWSLLQAYGLEGYETESSISVPTRAWIARVVTGKVTGRSPSQGFLLRTDNDRSLLAVSTMFQRGLTLFAARKDLDWGGQRFPRGSVFIPRRSNPPSYEAILDSIAQETGVTFVGINSGKGNVGPDIGSGQLEVLENPKIALVAGGNVSFTSAGWIWHQLDQRLGVPVSLIDVSQLGFIDLSIYSTLILPDGWSYSSVIGRPAVERMRSWIESGGTLIAMGSGAAFCTDSTIKLSSVRPREQVLAKLKEYERAATEELSAEKPDLKPLQVWEFSAKSMQEPDKEKKTPAPESAPPSAEDVKNADEMGQLFSPHGAILRVDLDADEWLTFGLGQKVPIMATGSNVLMAKFPAARTVGRYPAADNIRISGLLWPEARVRMAHSAYCTREQSGQGQVILFAEQPNFRAFFRGADRMLSNAVLFGPGLGTSRTPEW